jgi:phosphohistidine phosphatase
MHLCLLRHGKAEKLGALYTIDAMRPLTEEGAATVERVAKGLRAMGARFDLIFTSPLLRARQTAAIVAKTCGYLKEPEMDESLGGRFSPEMIAKNLEALPGEGTILLVGHAPILARLISYLISNDESTKVEMTEGAMAWVEVVNPTIRTGVLRWLIPPEAWLE